MNKFIVSMVALGLLAACNGGGDVADAEKATQKTEKVHLDVLATAIYAGGCFWCVEADLEKLDGVTEVVSGYTGGKLDNPTYKQVTYEDTGHREAARVYYDPAIISYEKLTRIFVRTIDVTDAGGQFCDRGFSYTTAVFTSNEVEKEIATRLLVKAGEELGKKIVTPVLEASRFYDAEDFHQDYYKKNPIRYKYYRNGCGRDKKLQAVWNVAKHQNNASR